MTDDMKDFLKLMGEELLPPDVRDLSVQDSLSGKFYLKLRFFEILNTFQKTE